MRFFRKEYWSGLLFPSLGDLANPGIESTSPVTPVLQADSSPVYFNSGEGNGNPVQYSCLENSMDRGA